VNEPAEPILDEAILAELSHSVEGDDSFVRELIDAYAADGASHLAAIEGAGAAGDAEALVRPAHTLKSSSATLGAPRVAAVARRLEMAGRSGALDTDATAGDLAIVRSEWEAAVAALRGWAAAEGAG
jgi:HPt (histidine-containing phosphotransfer) domain-containing protein